jgi:predicted GIY-YIG superfamily endonuclease
MAYFMYILECADRSLYVGHTSNLESRVRRHQEGRGARYTAARLPIRLLYSEECRTLGEAVGRERQIKRWSAEKKRALIDGRLADLKRLACRRRT